MKNISIKILECHHKKETSLRVDKIYSPIQVGRAISNEKLDMLGDDTGDNISEKNRTYCELTATYWAWKNLDKIDFIGLCHYRRHFNLSKVDLEKELKKYDIMLIEPDVSPYSNMFRLISGTTREDAYILFNVIHTFFPDYREGAINYLFNSNKWIPYNMLVASSKHFNSYCQWLFEVLAIVEKQILFSEYSRLKRVLGYMGEVLLGIYCTSNHLKIKYVNLEEEKESKFKERLILLRNEISFKLNNPFKIERVCVPASTLAGFKNDKIVISPDLQNM